jgi:Flp pilus assembly protein TadG
MSKTNKCRNRRPQGTMMVTLLIFVVSVFILLSLGVFSYEAMRSFTARDELRSATEAASLAAVAALASSDTIDPAAAHLNAIAAAHAAFNSNTIVGNRLSTALTAGNASHVPPAGQSSLYIQFLDPNNNNAPTAGPNYINGTNVRCVGAYTLVPAFNVGVGTHPIRAESKGRTPTLDLVLCLDVSSSIDDQTVVTFVRRIWNGSRLTHEIVGAPAGSYQLSSVSPRAAGKILDILTPLPVGTSVNGCPPQQLTGCYSDGCSTPLRFSAALRNGGLAADVGVPPGNYPPATTTWTPIEFTDLVVNLDGRNDFAGFTHNGYQFPDLATLVEAARGNLENNTVFTGSLANTAVSVSPRAGYQAAYLDRAYQMAEPISTARRAATRFYQIMNTNTDAHFGFVSFSSGTYTDPNGTYNATKVDSGYAAGGVGTFPRPGVALSASQSNYNEIVNPATGALTRSISANGGTNIGQAVQTATDMLASSASRQNAKRAIIVFTDGHWNTGPDPFTSANNTRAANKDIAIYTIGLAQNAALIPFEVDTLNDLGAGVNYTYQDPRTNAPGSYTASRDGISKIAGNDGKFFLVTDERNLGYVFENIARHLVQLMH